MKRPKTNAFREFVEAKMAEHGLTQVTLGKIADLNQSAVSRVLTGFQALSIVEAYKFGKALKVTTHDVVDHYLIAFHGDLYE